MNLSSQADESVDVLVIGGGPGGTPAALALAQAGRRVLLVEQGDGLGGTCLFEGCIPSKIFRESALRLHAADRAGEFGVGFDAAMKPVIDWQRVLARKRDILAARAAAALRNAQALPTLQIVRGHARLLGAHRAEISLPGAAPRGLRFAHAILAAGAQAAQSALVGSDLAGVHASEQLLSLDRVPDSLLLVGGGPIGVEMAQIFHLLGSRVTLLQGRERILPSMDADLALQLQQRLQDSGIDLRCGARAQCIVAVPGGLRVTYSDAQGNGGQIEAQHVGLALGRAPRVADLGLEHTRIRHDGKGLRVDAQLQTDEPDIYAVGDLLGQPMFAHWATAQAQALAAHLLGKPTAFPKPEHNSAVIFSHPEFATAGLTVAQAQAAGLIVDTASYDYAIDARAQIGGETGLLRFVFERDSRRIVGVHALIEGASDLIGEGALIVRHGLTLEQLAQAIHPHPTLTESMGVLARQTLARLQGLAMHAHHPVP
ncbi:MAG: dihydrolipoyl dehydrogenase family protein [Metallibacterium scheffleri]|jgi:dihydrolipoamide dehydrogenase